MINVDFTKVENERVKEFVIRSIGQVLEADYVPIREIARPDLPGIHLMCWVLHPLHHQTMQLISPVG